MSIARLMAPRARLIHFRARHFQHDFMIYNLSLHYHLMPCAKLKVKWRSPCDALVRHGMSAFPVLSFHPTFATHTYLHEPAHAWVKPWVIALHGIRGSSTARRGGPSYCTPHGAATRTMARTRALTHRTPRKAAARTIALTTAPIIALGNA